VAIVTGFEGNPCAAAGAASSNAEIAMASANDEWGRFMVGALLMAYRMLRT